MGARHKKAIAILTWVVVAVHFRSASAKQSLPLASMLERMNNPPNMAQTFQTFLKNLDGHREILMDDSDNCLAHLLGWADNIMGEFWSLQMLDAMSKIPEGMLSGHSNSLGDFDECLGVRGRVNLTDNIQSDFKGKYCLTVTLPSTACQLPEDERQKALRLHQQQQRQPRLGPIFEMEIYPGGAICVPSKCSMEELQGLLVLASDTIGACILVSNCQTDDKPELRTNDIVMIVILALIGVLCVAGTCVDLLFANDKNQQQQVSKPMQAIIAFSFYTNTKKWLNTSGGSDNLGCIHGMRFLSTCWVVLAHTWATWITKIWNIMDVIFMGDDWTILPVLNGYVSVDSFFTMAGILAAYNLMKLLDKTKGRLNVPMVYLHRYLRLTPCYAILVGIMATWFEHLKKGPNTLDIAHSAAACRAHWWHNLLYINNLFIYDKVDMSKGPCHGESWYLANDMQFFLISPLLLWPLWKWRTVGSIIMGGFTLASVVVPFVVTYHYELLPTMIITYFDKVDEFSDKNYQKPWMRFSPYIVGLWAGYLLYLIRKRKKPLKLPKLVVIIGWLTCTAVALAVIFGAKPYFEPEAEYKRLSSAFYGSLHRFAWGAVISWVVLACTMGYGGIINTFLSWKVFIPLGRLSFCVYMISFWLQTLYYQSARQHTTYDLYTAINHFFAHMVMSLLVSFVACMAFESPFIALEKIIFGGDKKPSSQPPVVEKAGPNVHNSDNGVSINNEAHEEKLSAEKNPV